VYGKKNVQGGKREKKNKKGRRKRETITKGSFRKKTNKTGHEKGKRVCGEALPGGRKKKECKEFFGAKVKAHGLSLV